MVLNKKHKQKIPVYVTENDIKNSTILRLAYLNNLISQVEYKKILEDNNLVLDSQYMTEILKNFFGFDDGLYEEHFIEGSQVTRVTKEVVVGVKRYCGVERVDDGWIESGLASQEAKEINKFGELLRI